jgi:hypothetical protein
MIGRVSCPGGQRLAAAAVALLAAGGVVGVVPSAVQASAATAATWTKQAPATSPPFRFDAAMAYDAATGNIVLFGGIPLYDDTWTWDGSTWTKQAPASHPPARYGAAMAYDAATGNVVLFGGQGTPGIKDGTWTWG